MSHFLRATLILFLTTSPLFAEPWSGPVVGPFETDVELRISGARTPHLIAVFLTLECLSAEGGRYVVSLPVKFEDTKNGRKWHLASERLKFEGDTVPLPAACLVSLEVKVAHEVDLETTRSHLSGRDGDGDDAVRFLTVRTAVQPYSVPLFGNPDRGDPKAMDPAKVGVFLTDDGPVRAIKKKFRNHPLLFISCDPKGCVAELR
ncbi:MAG: hypothetical protein V1798_12065 [Pseudomonadota bacterium]